MSDSNLADILTKFASRIAEMERRFEGLVVQGTVHEVDPEAGTVRLKAGEDDDGKPFLTAPIPYSQMMGALKLHTPPSVGQQMTAFNAAGDFRQGLAMPMTQADANKSPSTKGDEHVLTFGDLRVEIRGKQLKATIGGFVLDATDKGLKLAIGGSSFDLTSSGLKMVADDYQFD